MSNAEQLLELYNPEQLGQFRLVQQALLGDVTLLDKDREPAPPVSIKVKSPLL